MVTSFFSVGEPAAAPTARILRRSTMVGSTYILSIDVRETVWQKAKKKNPLIFESPTIYFTLLGEMLTKNGQ